MQRMFPMREFKIGQYVSYQRHNAEGRFVVIRLLAQPKGEPRYVIRSEENKKSLLALQNKIGRSRQLTAPE